jgi:hypothetical protein
LFQSGRYVAKPSRAGRFLFAEWDSGVTVAAAGELAIAALAPRGGVLATEAGTSWQKSKKPQPLGPLAQDHSLRPLVGPSFLTVRRIVTVPHMHSGPASSENIDVVALPRSSVAQSNLLHPSQL